MHDVIRRQIVDQTGGRWRQAAWGAGVAAVTLGLRVALTPLVGDTVPYIAFFPGILLASLFGGGLGGMVCVALCAAAGQLLYPAPVFVLPPALAGWPRVPVFVISSSVIVWLGSQLRHALIDLEAARERQDVLVAELQHRVKNTLAIVQSMAVQSFRSHHSQGETEDFTDRLIALGQAHNLLSDATWGDVTLEDLARRALKPFDPGEVRVRVVGDPVRIPSDQVVNLALCLHELATNAIKHGALSRPHGVVDLTWTRLAQAPQRLRLSWCETGGPPAVEPRRSGFGMRLLRRGLGERVRPKVTILFQPAGLSWVVEFDAA